MVDQDQKQCSLRSELGGWMANKTKEGGNGKQGFINRAFTTVKPPDHMEVTEILAKLDTDGEKGIIL